MCVALVSLSFASSELVRAQPGGPASSPPPPPSRTTNPDVPPKQGSGSGGTTVGVQIDVGQVIGGLSKLRQEREARRKEREAAAVALAQRAAEAAAQAARDKAPPPTKAVEPTVTAVKIVPTEPTPVKAPSDQIRPVVMFTPSTSAKPKVVPKVAPNSVVTVQPRLVSPPILPTRKPIVAPKAPAVTVLPKPSSFPPKALTAKAPPIIAQAAKPRVAIAPIVPEAAVLPLEIGTPLPLPAQQNPSIDAVPSAIQAPILAEPTVQAKTSQPDKPTSRWPLWAAIGLGALAVGALLRRLLGAKSSQRSGKNETDQLDRTITGYGLADGEPQSTLTFDDGKGLLPAILTSLGETNSVLVFETDTASTQEVTP